MIIRYLWSAFSKLHSSFNKNLSSLMIFCFGLAWKAITLFPYMYLATTMASSYHVRVEINLD